MKPSRRKFLQTCGTIGAAAWLAPALAGETPAAVRQYNLSITPHTPEPDPELIEAIRRAGVSDVWINCFCCGHWWCGIDRMKAWRSRIEAQGMRAHVLNIPLGHPGLCPAETLARGHLGRRQELHRHLAPRSGHEGQLRCVAADRGGGRETGVSWTTTSAWPRARLDRRLLLPRAQAGVSATHGLWRTPVARPAGGHRPRPADARLRAWVEFTCDQLTECFRAQQKAVPGVQLGIMVMYFGAEKAGIRLTDYRDVPMRVGEYKFDDETFAPVKGKTDELFSSLFHRRFVRPELAYSETTAFPDKQLSLKNKVAKLAVSTLSDVRNTMFMCDFPKEHWPTLAPAMKRHADIHARIAGHIARGPLKHFWGEASRYTGDDNPYSLFMALGVPFEVTGEPAADGFTFLSDADAGAVGSLQFAGHDFCRPAEGRRTRWRSLCARVVAGTICLQTRTLAAARACPVCRERIAGCVCVVSDGASRGSMEPLGTARGAVASPRQKAPDDRRRWP